MGWGLVLPSFRPSCHLLYSKTFRTMETTAAEKKSIWKNLIIGHLLMTVKLKLCAHLPESYFKFFTTCAAVVSSKYKAGG